MVARPAEATKASSFAVLARRNNQNRMALGVGMISHALRAGNGFEGEGHFADYFGLNCLAREIWSDRHFCAPNVSVNDALGEPCRL
jgi:hypothetical protein